MSEQALGVTRWMFACAAILIGGSFALLVVYFIVMEIHKKLHGEADDDYTVTFTYMYISPTRLTPEDRVRILEVRRLEDEASERVKELYDAGASGRDIVMDYDQRRQFIRLLNNQ